MRRPVVKAVRRSRGWLERVARRRRHPRGLILLYHRISESPADPSNLCVSPGNFRAQLKALGRHADVVPLNELQDTLCRARPGRAVASITFDDGYVDNLTNAVPALLAAGMPATVFLATRWVGLNAPFWWDRLAWMILAPATLPGRLDLRFAGQTVRWAGRAGGGPRWLQRLERRALYHRLWETLRHLGHDGRDAVLADLGEWSASDPTPAEAGRAVTPEEARQLASSGIVEIGAHTVNHPMLPELSAEHQLEEVRASLDACMAITGVRPRSLAYPHGRADLTTLRMTGEAGLEIACTGVERLVRSNDHTLALPRVSVHDWSGRSFERWLKWYWLP